MGKEIGEHVRHAARAARPNDRLLSIAAAAPVSFVAVLAAYSGYTAAKRGTESFVTCTKANRTHLEALEIRTLDLLGLPVRRRTSER